MSRFSGTSIPNSPFADDDGSTPQDVEGAFSQLGRDPAAPYALLRALISGRLLVPVVAVLDSLIEAETESPEPEDSEEAVQLPAEKDSHMASVTLVGPDGKHGLVAFSGVEHVQRWRDDARPIPVRTVEAAAAAHEAGQVLIIDPDRLQPLLLDGDELEALAAGVALAEPWLRDDVREAVLAVLGPGIASEAFRVRLEPPAQGGAARLTVEVSQGVRLDAQGMAQALEEALAGLPGLARGLEIVTHDS